VTFKQGSFDVGRSLQYMCYFYSVTGRPTLHCLKFIQWERYLDRILSGISYCIFQR